MPSHHTHNSLLHHHAGPRHIHPHWLPLQCGPRCISTLSPAHSAPAILVSFLHLECDRPGWSHLRMLTLANPLSGMLFPLHVGMAGSLTLFRSLLIRHLIVREAFPRLLAPCTPRTPSFHPLTHHHWHMIYLLACLLTIWFPASGQVLSLFCYFRGWMNEESVTWNPKKTMI